MVRAADMSLVNLHSTLAGSNMSCWQHEGHLAIGANMDLKLKKKISHRH